MSDRDNLRGLLWMLASVLASSTMSVAVRVLSESMHPGLIVFWRAAITALAIAVILALSARLRGRLRFSRPRRHIMRGVLIGVSTHLGFYTLAEIPLATAAILFFTAPIFATLLAVPMLGERVGPRRWLAVLVGFLGALIVLRPGFSALHPAMLAALASSALFAIALLLSRGLSEADGTFSTVTSSTLLTLLVSVPLVAPVFDVPSFAGWGWALVGLVALSGTGRGFSDILAYRYGEASVVGPVTYLRLVIVGLFGYLVYDERIDGPTLLGAAIIIGSTVYIARRAARSQNRRRARSAAEIVPSSR